MSTSLVMKWGTDRSFDVPITNADGSPVTDLTGWTAWFTAKLQYSDDDVAAVIAQSTLNGGVVVVAGGPGVPARFRAFVPRALTAILSPAVHTILSFGWRVKDTSGNEDEPDYGTLTVRGVAPRTM